MNGGVRGWVAQATRVQGLARAAEALLIGIAAGFLGASCALTCGGSGPSTCLGAALFAGVPLALTWWIEKRPDPRKVARKADRTLRMSGALLTAWEAEGRGARDSSISAELIRVVRTRTDPLAIVRATRPSSMPLLALPIVGVVLLALTLEGRAEEQRTHPTNAAVMSQMAGAMAPVLDDAFEGLSQGELTSEQVLELRDAAAQVRAVAAEASRAQTPEDEQAWRDELEKLVPKLEELAEEHLDRSAIVEGLEQALALSDVAGAGQEPQGPTLSQDPGPPGESGVSPGGANVSSSTSGGPGTGETPSESGSDGGSPLAADGPGGTIPASSGSATSSGDADPADLSSDPSVSELTPGSAEAARGLALGPWWPARHAGTVRRYFERRQQDPSESE